MTRGLQYRKRVYYGKIRERVVRKHLWGSEFLEDGRFTRIAGDKASAEVIRKYIQYHPNQESNPQQLELFYKESI